MVKIAFTGGHHTGALVVAKELKKKGYEIVWFGHRHTMAGDKNESQEYFQVSRAGIKFIDLKVPKLFNISLPVYFYRLGKYWPKFYSIWQSEKIDVLVGFGGYLMVLPAIAAWLTRVPFFIHEQTRIAGRANYWLSFLAKKVFVSWPIKYPYSKKKTIYTGLPLRSSFRQLLRGKVFPPIIKKSNYPTLLVTAGKQGSHYINNLIKENLDFILKHFNLIHQTGSSSLTNDYSYFSQLAAQANKNYPTLYQVYPYLDDEQMMSAYSQADLITGRSGAHTTYELVLLKKPAILIPAEFVPLGEQLKNAEFLKSLGYGCLLRQTNEVQTNFKHCLELFLSDGFPFKPKKYPLVIDGHRRIINQLISYLNEKNNT